MDRRSLLFVILLNSLISLVIAIVVVWAAELRRPDLEELAARYTPPPPVVLIATPTPGVAPLVVATTPSPAASTQSDPSPAPQPTSSDPQIYVVQAGDSLFGIALRYNLTVDQLLEANDLDNPDFVFSGQRLVIPQPGQATNNGSAAPTAAAAANTLSVQVEQAGNLPEESILIVNDSNSAVNLQGWTLGKVDGPVYAFNDLPLFPGGSVRLHSEAGQDDSLNLYWSQSAPVWASGAVVRLFNADGREVVTYTVP